MPPDDVIVTHHILVLANNPHTKFADWVAYQITLDSIGTHCIRRWERDPAINASDTLEPRDYVGIRNALRSDRGHQAPLASLCGSPFWQEADYLSNITPQKTNLNEGAWEHLERAERALVSSAGAVYSVTGPLYERPMPSLPKSRHSEIVPSAYWKVIAVTRQSEILITAFIMDQDSPRDTNYCSDVVSVSEVERRAHLVFMSKMAEVERVAIETGGGVVALNRAIGCQ
jgi:endonuclease G